MYQIETGIPVPTKPGRVANTYPFTAMQVGDSFAVPVPVGEGRKQAIARVTSAKAQHARRHNVKFTVRVMDDSMRVWRTA